LKSMEWGVYFYICIICFIEFKGVGSILIYLYNMFSQKDLGYLKCTKKSNVWSDSKILEDPILILKIYINDFNLI